MARPPVLWTVPRGSPSSPRGLGGCAKQEQRALMLAKPWLCAFAASTLLWSGAGAQEAKPEQKVEQKIPGVDTKPLLDNEQMKVFEVRFKPGAMTPALSHANRFVYALTDGSLVFSPAGKTPYELTFKNGEALWLPADETTTKNETDRDVR